MRVKMLCFFWSLAANFQGAVDVRGMFKSGLKSEYRQKHNKKWLEPWKSQPAFHKLIDKLSINIKELENISK
jgi:hypothetical protein